MKFHFLFYFIFAIEFSHAYAEKPDLIKVEQAVDQGLAMVQFDMGCDKSSRCLTAEIVHADDSASKDDVRRYIVNQAKLVDEVTFVSTRPSTKDQWVYVPHLGHDESSLLQDIDDLGLLRSEPKVSLELKPLLDDVVANSSTNTKESKNALAYVLELPQAIYSDFHSRSREELTYVVIRSVTSAGSAILISRFSGLSIGSGTAMVAALAMAWNGSLQYYGVKISEYLQQRGLVSLLKPHLGDQGARFFGLFGNRFMLSSFWIVTLFASIDLAAGLFPDLSGVTRPLMFSAIQMVATHPWAAGLRGLVEKAEHDPGAKIKVHRIGFGIGIVASLNSLAGILGYDVAFHVFGGLMVSGLVFYNFEKIGWFTKYKIIQPLKGLSDLGVKVFGACGLINSGTFLRK